ncbi:MAG: two pore domain potassium channel family protein [Bacteroidales bacterium]|nr:two pore domain potassium channel family protein [Bacteroidales bacterium]MBN2697888.1 two pore domain potassium channel family protein [Bacteroidales bacterium]
MFPRYTSFKVDIKNLKFKSESGIVYPKTAIILFDVPGKNQPVMELLGYIEDESVYRWIDEAAPIILDYCYIPRFSLSDYRASRGLSPKEKINLKGFSARHSFFDSQVVVDFSDSMIKDGSFSLAHTWFNRGSISFNSSRFENTLLDFSYLRFSDDSFDFQNVTVVHADVIFKNAIFGRGVKDFQYSRFGGRELNFINTEFNDGPVNFINVHFESENTSFKVARFGDGKVDFHYAKFKTRNLSFERTEFGNGRVDFRTVEFGTGKVNFNRASFGDGDVSFESSEKEAGKFSFKRVRFGRGTLSFEMAVYDKIDVSFERTEFGPGTISFYRAGFNALSFRFCHLDEYTDLRVAHCRQIDLSNTVVRDIIDLQPYEFELDVEQTVFAGMRLVGKIYLDWKQNHVQSMIAGQEYSGNRLKAEQFRLLKENFKNLGQYSDEDKSYVAFKRHELKAELEDSVKRRKINALWHYPFYLFKLILFDRAGLYATSPLRVLLTMLIAFVFFSLFYMVLMVYTPADIVPTVDDLLSPAAKAFYHSAITFLTIGYGDHYPYGSIRWVSAFEGFAGLFLMAYFTVAFVRKILR